jgi:hypothetical protein
MSAQNWDLSYSPYENAKQNLISLRSSQNRFGAKFKKIFEKNAEGGEYPYYYFTKGMRSLFKKDDIQGQIDKTSSLLTKVSDIFAVSLTGTAYKIEDSKDSSYIAVQYFEDSMSDTFTLGSYQIVTCANISASGTDSRKKSAYLGSITQDRDIELDPLEDASETFGLKLVTEDATSYGSYSNPTLPAGINSSTFAETFTVDATLEKNPDDNFIFRQDMQAKFDDIKNDFEAYLQEYIQSTYYYAHHSPGIAGSDIIVLSLGQFMDYLQDSTVEMVDFRDDIADERAKEDLELIKLLNLESSLKTAITKPHKIRSIWFHFNKTCTMPESGNWWEAEELKGMKPIGVLKKAMLEHCEVTLDDSFGMPVGAGGEFSITVKKSFLTLPNWQICLFVQNFMDIQTKVKKRWYEKGLGKLLIAIVTVALIVLTENPTWAKVLLATTAVASQYGIIGGEVQMLVTAAMMVYGVASADFSSMSGADMFNFAVTNINMTANLVNLNEQMSIEAQMRKRQKEFDDYYTAQKQDEVMKYIYTDGYDEYTSFYDVLYRY